MKFNVAKCHSMRVTRHYLHKQIIHDYTLHQQTLENVQSVKYLGITITENLDWGQDISDISSKATKTLGFLRRNLAFAPRSTKEVAYKTLVRPKLEYAAPSGALIVKLRFNKWRRYRGRQPAGPAGGGATLVVLEKCLMSCNGQLWTPGGISPLCFSSTRFIVGLCLLIKDKYLTPSQSTRSTRSSHNSQYCRPQTYSDGLKYSFFPRTILHWNSLAPSVVAAETTEEFRALI